jgi:hypothetical protein
MRKGAYAMNGGGRKVGVQLSEQEYRAFKSQLALDGRSGRDVLLGFIRRYSKDQLSRVAKKPVKVRERSVP